MIGPARTHAGRRLRPVDDPVRARLHDFAVAVRLVVEARDVDFIRELVADRLLPVVEGGGRGTRWIVLVIERGESLRFLPAVGLTLLRDLVADAPEDDARVIAVPMHHVTQVTLRPLIVELAVAVRHLRDAPHIEGLVHHEEPEPIGELEEFRRRWIVARADGVDAGGLQDLELPLGGSATHRRAQRTEVVMQAYTVQLERTAIQQKTFL